MHLGWSYIITKWSLHPQLHSLISLQDGACVPASKPYRALSVGGIPVYFLSHFGHESLLVL